MVLPQTLEDAIAQACEATEAALADGQTRLQVELLFPELKLMPIAQQFLPIFEKYGDKLKVFFADAGSAAFAKNEWSEAKFQILDVGTGRTSTGVEKIQPEDEIFFFVAPTSVEVQQLESLCEQIGTRPLVMLNPRLEDLGAVGIGYAARKLRDRFISTIESCYYLRPVDDEVAVFRCYPRIWEVWINKGDKYEKIADLPKKPSSDDLDKILASGQSSTSSETSASFSSKKPSVFKSLQRFIRALSR